MPEPNVNIPKILTSTPAETPAPATAITGATATQPEPTSKPKTKSVKAETKDPYREIAETVVFVVVLVILLRMFVAEAFVIPTGSMAETLYGHQKIVTCPNCGFTYPVNCSNEVDPQRGTSSTVVEAGLCPNCTYEYYWGAANNGPGCGTGDRVLVAKFLYDLVPNGGPNRHDVVVFKYPVAPQQRSTPMNYIKRLVGLPGETLAIFNGDLFVNNTLTYDGPDYPPIPQREEDLSDYNRARYMYINDKQAVDAFAANQFRIIRKTPDKMLALRRIVYDNDYQPADLLKVGAPTRWSGEKGATSGWITRQTGTTAWEWKHPGKPEYEWLRYQHYITRHGNRDTKIQTPSVELITNNLGYNSDMSRSGRAGSLWVGDLMSECQIQFDRPIGEVAFELAKGPERFRATFDLASGTCTLARVSSPNGEDIVTPLPDGKAQTDIHTRAGRNVHVRFANFDERLTLWLDGNLIFGEGVPYSPVSRLGPVSANDLERPARIGAKNAAVTVTNLQLWRDTAYSFGNHTHASILLDGATAEVQTYYVQPGHYMCLGDNSDASSDSRYWGLVPQRLMLGRAMMVYYPLSRFGIIR